MNNEILEKFGTDGEIYSKSVKKAAGTAKSRAEKVVKVDRGRIYFEQLLCLLLLCGISFWNSGARVAVMAAFTLVGAVAMDMAGCAMSKKTYNPRDLSTLTSALCIALLMPAGVDYRLAFFGSALTIAVKHIFGGKDNYIFNPTAVIFAFLVLCYPGQMLLFPNPLERLPVWGEINAATLTGSASIGSIGIFDILRGNFAGAMGTVHILVILVTAVCLLFRRSMSATVTLSALAANLLFSGAFSASGGFVRASLGVMVSGSFLFILVFLANDPQTLPKTFLGRLYYGVMFGAAVAAFGRFGKVEGYPAFALLVVNTMTERSDILARQTIEVIAKYSKAARDRLNSYERVLEKAETGLIVDTRPTLSDTQEIILECQDYNMPPVDGKIIKINRKKPGLFARIREKISGAAEKRKFTEADIPQTTKGDFMEHLRDGLRDLKAVFVPPPGEDEPEPIPPELPQEQGDEQITPLDLLLMIDDDDVVEVEPDDSEESKRKKKKKAGKK